LHCGTTPSADYPLLDHQHPTRRPETNRKSWANQRLSYARQTPIKINNQLGALLRIIETGDAKPTDQSYVVYKELSAQLDAIKQRLDAILTTEVTQFNSAATTSAQPPIK